MRPDSIIIHHSLTKDSETVSWGAIRRYHTVDMGWRDIGYHYGVELVGVYYEVLLGRFANMAGAHTKGMNERSIGVCVVGNFDVSEPPKEQWDAAVSLVQYLLEEHKISKHRVFGHNYFASYKSCPGKMFNMDRFRGCLV